MRPNLRTRGMQIFMRYFRGACIAVVSAFCVPKPLPWASFEKEVMPVFEFINPDDPKKRSKAKSHIAKRAHQKKRLHEAASFLFASRIPAQLQDSFQTSISQLDVRDQYLLEWCK